MNCADARTMLAACHDGELSPADRARLDEHLRGCEECSAILARLAEIDAKVDVPDPGPEYWERFNRRVMERAGKDADVPAKALRPKRGWAGRRLPYFIPAVAAAALLLLVVRQAGIDPFSRTSVPTVPRETAQSTSEAEPGAVPRAALPAKVSPSSKGAGLRKGNKAAPPATLSDEGGKHNASAAGGQASLAEERMAGPSGEEKERSARGVEAAPRALPASSPEPFRNDADRAVRKSMASAAPAAVAPSPCEAARSLAGRGRLKEAETAQRACLARETSPVAQESGMVFLAELLDRQSRIAEADAVLRETRRRFPDSRPVDEYLRQRTRVQGRPVPETR